MAGLQLRFSNTPHLPATAEGTPAPLSVERCARCHDRGCIVHHQHPVTGDNIWWACICGQTPVNPVEGKEVAYKETLSLDLINLPTPPPGV